MFASGRVRRSRILGPPRRSDIILFAGGVAFRRILAGFTGFAGVVNTGFRTTLGNAAGGTALILFAARTGATGRRRL